jgi:flagellar motor switch protein FliM
MKQLSQNEIDLLLDVRSQMDDAPGGYDLDALENLMQRETERRVLPYNFKRPRLFSQDQMRVLNYVHDSFARDFSVFLSAQLRTIVDISLTAVDQVMYSEYVMSSAPPSAIYVAEEMNLNHKLVFEFDPRLVVFTIEKLFGGQGTFLKKSREVSQIERRIMSKVMKRCFTELEKSWRQAQEVKFREIAFETNAEFVQIIPAVEPALVCTFEVTVYENKSFINLCYPYLLLEKMLGRAGLKQWISGNTAPVPPEHRERYETELKKVQVELRAELGRALVSLQDISDLQPGDVIPLGRTQHDPIQVFAGKGRKFAAQPGRSGKRHALRILEALPPPPQFSDPED